jgi:hypothetical protein
VIRGWQTKGVKLDYFTLDTGWPDKDGDLTQFASACYPDGPGKIVEGIRALDMKMGLWFSVSGGGWSDGSYPAVQPSAIRSSSGSLDMSSAGRSPLVAEGIPTICDATASPSKRPIPSATLNLVAAAVISAVLL